MLTIMEAMSGMDPHVLCRWYNRFLVTIKQNKSQVLVAQACNPSYSGGRDQEDRGSEPDWANSS
jgi:uncharacterized protein YodC (DUF2158 family)